MHVHAARFKNLMMTSWSAQSLARALFIWPEFQPGSELSMLKFWRESYPTKGACKYAHQM